jgi:hypothetical protein
MPSSKSEDEMAALRSKVAQLEAKQKIQRMGMKMQKELMKMQQAMAKRDLEAEKKELEMKTTLEKMEAASADERRDRLIENERRDRLAEKKEMLAVFENERRDRLMGDERRDRLTEKKEMMAMLEKKEGMVALENERRERLAEKKETIATAALEKKEMMAMFEKKEGMVALENERRERQAEKKENIATAALEKKEMVGVLEKKEMMAVIEKHEKEHQHQLEQLKSEARISQMEQQLLEMRAYTGKGIPISQPTVQPTVTLAVDPAPQRDTELPLQRIQQMEKEKEKEQLKGTGIQPTLAIPNDDSPAHAHTPDASHQKTLQSTAHKSAEVSHASKTPSQQASLQSSSLQASKPNEPSAASIAASRSTQQQHQVMAPLPQGTSKTAQRGPVPLPGDSENHFFLSHCQSTGGDQTNAIYLELRQLGFACWYDNRADDLTKEGMRQGIVHAAAFLLFLSKGVLDRPFCKYFYLSSNFILSSPYTPFHRPI